MKELPLQDVLLRRGLISPDQLRIAEKESRLSGVSIERALLSTGFVSPALIRDFRGRTGGKDTIELADLNPDSQVVRLISQTTARSHCVLPLSFDAPTNTLCIAMEKAHDVLAMDTVVAQIKPPPILNIKIASRADILDAIDRIYGSEMSIDKLMTLLDTETKTLHAASNEGRSGASAQLIEALLTEAVRGCASDIHFEPEMSYIRIRYRIDGVLRLVRSIHKAYWSSLSVRLKILSNLNIAEKRAPQDGRFEQTISGRNVDFRVSCFPSVHGENIVIRLLDRSEQMMDISQLGLSGDMLRNLRMIIRKPAGLIIMSGPTGSGKTTTLYSLLNEIRDNSINIVTLEDPVEFNIPLLRQCSVNQSAKLDFASGIRSILRQDPDVILVGETRDKATAEMVVRAALTGHLVLTTLHSQSALASLSRLEDLGLNLSHLSGHILALVAQRLVRKLCPECKRAVPVPTEYQALFADSGQVFEAVGCHACEGIGYRGRQVILECILSSAALNVALVSNSPLSAIAELHRKARPRSLAKQGLSYVSDGTISLQELSREIDLDQLEALE